MIMRGFLCTLAVAAASAAGLLAVSGFTIATRDPPPLTAVFGSTILTIPGRIVRDGSNHRTTGDIELGLLWPEMKPLRQRAAQDAGQAQIFVSLKLAQQEPLLSSSSGEFYGPFFEPETWAHPSGLIVRRFRETSPFRDEEIYLAPPEGRAFFARCAKAGALLDTSAEHCLWLFGYRDVLVQARFAPELLAEWPQLQSKIEALMASLAQAPK